MIVGIVVKVYLSIYVLIQQSQSLPIAITNCLLIGADALGVAPIGSIMVVS